MNPYRFIIIAAALFVVLCGSQNVMAQEQTVEEKVLMNTLISMAGARSYDVVCNNGKISTAKPDDKDSVFWYGNRQTLAFLIAAPMKMRNPDATVEQGLERLVQTEESISKKADAILKEKGCKSDAALKMEKSLKTFSTMPPSVLLEVITKKIEQDGGKLTQLPDELNKVQEQPASKKSP